MPDTHSIVGEGLNWLYDRVIGDMPVVSAGNAEHDVDRAIRLACTQAGAAGFVANLGGVLTLPVALPANLIGTAAVQMRLVAKIASARGYDVESDEVRTFVFVCLLGNAAADVLKDVGIRMGAKLTEQMLQRLNATVFTRLMARFGAQGAASVTRFVPIISGMIGGGLDVASTRVVGHMAKRVFARRETEPAAPEIKAIAAPIVPTT